MVPFIQASILYLLVPIVKMIKTPLQAILLCSLACYSNGWVSTTAVAACTNNNQRSRHPTNLVSLLAGREPAGVETMSAKARQMRTGGSRRRTWFRGENRRRQRRFGDDSSSNVMNESGIQHNLGHVGQKEVVNMIGQVSLPPAWEFRNEKEISALASMKILLTDEYLDLANTTAALPGSGQVVSVVSHFPDVYGDIRLLRFLRKSKAGDPVAASLSFRRFLRWRKENNVDEIRAAIESQPFQVPPNLQLLAELLPCGFDMLRHGVASDSSPLITLCVGKWRTATLARVVRNEEMISLADFLDYWTYLFESVHQHLYLASLMERKMVFVDAISDFSGFSLQQLSPSFVSVILRPWIKQLQSNYPETARRIDVVHPPKVVSLLSKLVVPLLSPGTAAKLRIH